MDSKQIAFILCVNDIQYYEECLWYIHKLTVPKGYSIDVICIQEAASMAQGYNAGMRASNAKYKIYLHQDTFLLNPDFLYNILGIFQSDSSIGMIGVLGARKLPSDANCYLSWDTGRTYAYNGAVLVDLSYYQEENQCVTVEAIDGMIMVTQVDLPWREDFLDGWDFYDVSQSLEMRRQGFRIVIPYQEQGWCHHDCGVSKVQNYHFYRHKMLEAYPEYFKEEMQDMALENWKKEHMEKIAEIRSGLIGLIAAGAYDACCELVAHVHELVVEDPQICEITNLMEIYALEKSENDGEFCKWWLLKEWKEIYRMYKELRHSVLRLRFKNDKAQIEKILGQGFVSLMAVQNMLSKMKIHCDIKLDHKK